MDERSERIAARFERPLLVAAVLTVPVTILQLLPADDPWRTIADVLNWAIWLAFTVEVVVMLAVVPSKWGWVRHHPLEVLIVVFTTPFLTSVIQSARVLRILRLFRLLRLAPLVRVLFSAEGVRFAVSGSRCSRRSAAGSGSRRSRTSRSATGCTGRSRP